MSTIFYWGLACGGLGGPKNLTHLTLQKPKISVRSSESLKDLAIFSWSKCSVFKNWFKILKEGRAIILNKQTGSIKFPSLAIRYF